MTEDELARLEELAEKATPGPWRESLGSVYADGRQPGWEPTPVGEGVAIDARWPILAGENMRADAAYIAALDPGTVLSLIAALRATPVADTAGIDAAHLAAVLWAEFGWASPDPDQTRPTLLDADDPYWQQAAERSIAKLADPDLARAVSRIPALAAALRTPKPEGEPE